MKHIRGSEFRLSDTCVVFGRFDGLHVGHRAVIGKAVRMKKRGQTPVLLDFDCRPMSLFGDETVLYTEEEKAGLLASLGIEVFVSYPFSAAAMRMEPEEFVKEIIVEKLGAKTVVAGSGVRFGSGGKGDIALLSTWADRYGFDLEICNMVKEGTTIVSSELIRKEIAEIHLDRAGVLLGHPFTMFGNVEHGKALGSKAGLPTANLAYGKHKLIPPHGIYATLTRIGGEVKRGLTIIGLRPTVDNLPHVTVETYLLDFSRDIYGEAMQLEVHAMVRKIRKFRDLKAVKVQVDKDIESVRDYLFALK